MDFKKEYMFEWYPDEDYQKAELLWLWYDYHTEIYDRGLWSQTPAPNDETMVILHSPEARGLSNRNAARVRKYIMEIAKFYNLTDEVLNDAKNCPYRIQSKMQKRIDEFIELDNQGKFKFMYEIIQNCLKSRFCNNLHYYQRNINDIISVLFLGWWTNGSKYCC